MAEEYDISRAFERIEEELIASMIRNMDRHRAEESAYGYEWSQWQAEQLRSLEHYRAENQRKFGRQFSSLNQRIENAIRAARETGGMEQEEEILDAIRRGFTGYSHLPDAMIQGNFFRVNQRKLDALIQATTNDMRTAETAILRMANDQYRRVVFDAQVYAASGAGTYEKAVDMATHDMLTAGLNCVQYKNGARHTLADYADMAIRTACKRAKLQGEGQMRQEWGVSTVIMNKRGNPCPKCLPWVGKILIDDVWSGGSRKDGPYPLMSTAIAAGLYHPRCKDSHTTYFPGISTADDTWTREELEKIGQVNKQEAKQQYAERQAEKYGRLASYSLDPDNKEKYKNKASEWTEERYSVTDDIKNHREDTPKRMIDLIDQYTSDDCVVIRNASEHAFAYDPDIDAVVINTSHPYYAYYDYREIMIHEIAHRIDQNEFGSPMNFEFSEAILNAERRLLSEADKYNKLFDSGGELEYDNLISDILGCITDNVVVGDACHDSQYLGIPGYAELEVFANIFSAIYQGDDATVDFIKSELKDVYDAFLKIIGA